MSVCMYDWTFIYGVFYSNTKSHLFMASRTMTWTTWLKIPSTERLMDFGWQLGQVQAVRCSASGRSIGTALKSINSQASLSAYGLDLLEESREVDDLWLIPASKVYDRSGIFFIIFNFFWIFINFQSYIFVFLCVHEFIHAWIYVCVCVYIYMQTYTAHVCLYIAWSIR